MLTPGRPLPENLSLVPLAQATLDARTVHTLPGLWSGVHEFSSYGDGLSAAAGVESRDALMERVRVLAEASDSLQGELCLL